jgi:hypothetical protein
MYHPNHGWTHVSDGNIEEHRKHGWVNDDPKYYKKDIVKEPEKVETPEEAYEKKFGKPPHHRMKLESIIEALEI